jgi:hypothetical protein
MGKSWLADQTSYRADDAVFPKDRVNKANKEKLKKKHASEGPPARREERDNEPKREARPKN